MKYWNKLALKTLHSARVCVNGYFFLFLFQRGITVFANWDRFSVRVAAFSEGNICTRSARLYQQTLILFHKLLVRSEIPSNTFTVGLTLHLSWCPLPTPLVLSFKIIYIFIYSIPTSLLSLSIFISSISTPFLSFLHFLPIAVFPSLRHLSWSSIHPSIQPNASSYTCTVPLRVSLALFILIFQVGFLHAGTAFFPPRCMI